jgi:tetratricopeptide (TPR) repeat protein
VILIAGALSTGPAFAKKQIARQCGVPDAMLAVGEKERARKGYVALLSRQPHLACARRGLTTLNAPVDTSRQQGQTLCARGDGYLRMHRQEDALTAYKAALEKDAALPCAAAGIENAGPGAVTRALDGVGETLPRILLVGALVLVFLFVFLLIGHARAAYRWLVRLPVIGRIISPRLSFDTLGDQTGLNVGETITARVRARLVQMRDEAASDEAVHDLDFGSPTADFADLVAGDRGLHSALEKASEASEQLKIVAAMLNLLYTTLPIQNLAVAGVIEPASGAKASATLSLTVGGRPAASSTFDATGPTATVNAIASDYLLLAEPAAVWVQYEVARAIRGDDGRGPDAANSYALVREGLEKQLAGHDEEARTLFMHAVELDKRNLAARVNLAMAEARLRHNYDKSIEILDDVWTEMRGQ